MGQRICIFVCNIKYTISQTINIKTRLGLGVAEGGVGWDLSKGVGGGGLPLLSSDD